MSNIVEDIEKQVNIDKEVIEVLPRKGIKTIRTLKKTLEEMKEEYENTLKNVKNEIKTRYNYINDINLNKEIEKINNEIIEIEKIVNVCENKSSFQKMGLDRLIYNINGFYKKELNIVNNDIKECIKKFLEVGIKLKSSDFNISEYTQEYMQVLLEEIENKNINSQRVQDVFEKLYWKCSDIILHISVNIKTIYEDKENEIDKYYKNKKEEILNKLNMSIEEIVKRKKELIKRKKELENIDRRLIIDKFFNNTYNVVDFQKQEYLNSYEKLISKKISDLNEQEKNKMDENIEKLYSNLYEYNKYLKFKFIIDDILEIRTKRIKEKEEEKNKEKNLKKQNSQKNKNSNKLESQNIINDIKNIKRAIYKLNLKTSEKNKFNFISKKEKEEKKIERNRKILRLKDLYTRLEQEEIKEKTVKEIDETSKILDIFKLASSYYNFLATSIIKQFPDILEKDIHKMIDELKEFIKSSDISVINNVGIESSKEISIIIKDRYKLSGMMLSKSNFDERNIDELINEIKKLNDYNNMKKSGLIIEDMQFLINAKEMLSYN